MANLLHNRRAIWQLNLNDHRANVPKQVNSNRNHLFDRVFVAVRTDCAHLFANNIFVLAASAREKQEENDSEQCGQLEKRSTGGEKVLDLFDRVVNVVLAGVNSGDDESNMR